MRREPPWWWAAGASQWPARLLSPVAALFGWIGLQRFDRVAPYRSRLPVVCVGNLTAGGAGKTPVAIALARRLLARGSRPAFLLRGYGGREPGPLLVEPARHTAEEVGDEALLLARLAPTVVARRRDLGAQHIEALGTGHVDVIVMDDGFQNPTLHKDLKLVVVDALTGIGNGRVIPSGPLRLPLAWQVAQASAFIVVGAAPPPGLAALEDSQKPLLRASITPVGAEQFAGRRVVAFAGIGRPSKLFETLAEIGAELVACRAFPDHHAYSDSDATELLALGRDQRALLATTEKDWVRLPTTGVAGDLRRRAIALPIELRFAESDSNILEGLLDAIIPRSTRR